MLFLIELNTSIRLNNFLAQKTLSLLRPSATLLQIAARNPSAISAPDSYRDLRETHFAQVITEYATYPGGINSTPFKREHG